MLNRAGQIMKIRFGGERFGTAQEVINPGFSTGGANRSNRRCRLRVVRIEPAISMPVAGLIKRLLPGRPKQGLNVH